MLTKKDFVRMASIVRNMQFLYGKKVAKSLMIRFEYWCTGENPGFDKERFEKACFLSETEPTIR